jgi:hypothetical protein
MSTRAQLQARLSTPRRNPNATQPTDVAQAPVQNQDDDEETGNEGGVPLVEALPVCALSPALYGNDILQYNTKRAIDIYNRSVEKLHEELFDVDASGIHGFLHSLMDKAMTFGWDSILDIPDKIDEPNGSYKNLLKDYGNISLDHIKNWVPTYLNRESRAAQDSYALYQCLMNSLSLKGRSKITLYRNEYFVGMRPSGALLLKVIIRESRIDTRATVRHIRAKLNALPAYIASINYDIPAFNRYVLDLLEQLHARGETTHDLLANLFTAYKTCNDADFVYFIKRRSTDYDRGEDITEHTLMRDAQIQYQTQIGDGTWGLPTKEQEQIVALETKIKELTKKKSPRGNDRNNRNGKNGRGKQGGSNRSNGSQRNNNNDNLRNADIPEWKKKAPADKDKDKSKKKDGKVWWWCPHHNLWCIHKPSQCHKAPRNNNTNNNSNSQSSASSSSSNSTPRRQETSSSNPQLRLQGAVTSIREDSEE